MAESYRFLSAILGDRSPAKELHALVLEREDGQWWMYYLAPDKKIGPPYHFLISKQRKTTL